jgi:hypothetical protein
MDQGEDPTFDVFFDCCADASGVTAWATCFQGSFTLAAVAEIMEGFLSNGVVAAAWFLDPEHAMRHQPSIRAAFRAMGPALTARWGVAHRICPMMFAAAKGWDRAVERLSQAQEFEPQPNQRIGPGRGINVLAQTLEFGDRPDIALALVRAGASVETVAEAVSELEELADDVQDEEPSRANLLRAICSLLRESSPGSAGPTAERAPSRDAQGIRLIWAADSPATNRRE